MNEINTAANFWHSGSFRKQHERNAISMFFNSRKIAGSKYSQIESRLQPQMPPVYRPQSAVQRPLSRLLSSVPARTRAAESAGHVPVR